ncbi:MAG: serine/threonine-protein kinase [Polyangiaceae bacterium]
MQAPLLSPGDVIADKFRVERVIDEGGMGVVVAATHLVLDEHVALKFLRREVLGTESVVSRFAQEARAAVKLKSEHVARVSDVGHDPVRGPFIVMEYLEGQDLRDLLNEVGRASASEAVEYVVQACEGLAEAHARGIIHRDIKPENLFLVERSADWRIIKILDFGISKLRGAIGEALEGGRDTLPLMGSPCYMSPEQLRSNRNVDHRADIWSLGVVLFELLAGVPPFDGTRPIPELIASVLDEPTPPLGDFVQGLPHGLAEVVERCLEKDPAERWQTAAELAVALLPFAPRRARVPVERAIAIARASGMLSDPTLSLPPSFAPGPSDAAAAYLPRLGALSPSLMPDFGSLHSAPPSHPGSPPSHPGSPPSRPGPPPRGPGAPAAPLRALAPPTEVTAVTGSSFSHTSTVDFEPPPRRGGARWAVVLALLLIGGGGAFWMTRAPAADEAPAPVASAPVDAPPTAEAAAAPPPAQAGPAETASAKATAAGAPARPGPRRGGPASPPAGGSPPAKSDAPPSRPSAPDLEIRRTR